MSIASGDDFAGHFISIERIDENSIIYIDDIKIEEYDDVNDTQPIAIVDYSFSTNRVFTNGKIVGLTESDPEYGEAHSKGGCFKVSGISGNFSQDNIHDERYFEIDSTKKYKLSFWVKTINVPENSWVAYSIMTGKNGGGLVKRNKEFVKGLLDDYYQFSVTNNVPIFIGEWGLLNSSEISVETNVCGYVSDWLQGLREMQFHSTYFGWRGNKSGIRQVDNNADLENKDVRGVMNKEIKRAFMDNK